MTVVKIYKLEDTEETGPVSMLSEGQHTIGRGFLNCNDKRISRKHALLTIEKDSVTIKSVHVNPCFYKSSAGNSISILVKDKYVILNNNDQFALLADTFWFKVKVENDSVVEQYNKNLKDITVNNETQHSSTFTNKRSCYRSHDSPSKKQRISNLPSEESTSQINCLQTREIIESRDDSNEAFREIADCHKEENVNIPNNSSKEDAQCSSKTVENNDHNFVEEESKRVQLEDASELGISFANETTINISVEGQSSSATVREEQMIIQIKQEPPSDIDNNSTVDISHMVQSNSALTGEHSNITVKQEQVNNDVEQKPCVDSEQNNQTNQNDTTNDNNVIGNPNTDPPMTRRERCWYGQGCYRKNPQHRADFSHPGDDDYESDPDDQRPECPFGIACYRVNLDHRRQYKHRGKPAPKPSIVDPSVAGTSTQTPKQKKKRTKKNQSKKADDSSETDEDDDLSDSNTDENTPPRKTRKTVTKKKQLNETPEDDYDCEDPFINDGSSDEFELSDDGSDTDWEDSQQVDEESQETRRMLKEAKKFTRTPKKKK